MTDQTNRDAWLAVWRELWRPARWGLVFLSYAIVLRIGFHLGVHAAT